MLSKHLFLKNFKKHVWILLSVGGIFFQESACAQDQDDLLQRYVPEWLQQISQESFPGHLEEKQDIERSFEVMKPVPGESSAQKPFVQAKGREKVPAFRIWGPAELKNATIEGDVFVLGPLLFKNGKSFRLQVEGPFDGNDISFKGGDIKGPAKLEKAEVTDALTIHGSFLARTSSFKGEISVAGDKILLFSCQIQGDVVMLPPPSQKPQTVFLLEGTEIQGKVIFQQQNAQNRIVIDKKSKIYGEVSGATKIEQ